MKIVTFKDGSARNVLGRTSRKTRVRIPKMQVESRYLQQPTCNHTAQKTELELELPEKLEDRLAEMLRLRLNIDPVW